MSADLNMLSGLTGALGGSILAALAFTYLYVVRDCERRYLLAWMLGWWVYGLRHASLVAAEAWGGQAWLLVTQLALVIAVLLLAVGTYSFLGRQVSKRLLGLFLVVVAWLAYHAVVDFEPGVIAFPGALLAGGVFVWMGCVFLRSQVGERRIRVVVAALFVLWGLATGLFPFLVLQPAFGPVVHAIGAALGQGVALAVLIAYHQQTEQELRGSETRFREMTELLPEGMFETDAAGRVVFANPAALRMFGYEADDVGSGLTVADMLVESERERAAANLQRRRHGELVEGQEYTGQRRDGTTFPLMISNSAVYREGTFDGFRGVAVDLSTRKKLREAEDRLDMQLRQSQKLESIGTLAGGVAHEINNPINGIMNYAQLIRDSEEDPRQVVEYCDEIIHESERIAEIVRSLLDFARHEKQAKSTHDMSSIVHSVLSLTKTVLRHDQIVLEVDVSTELPSVQCRCQQIQQVLMNLVTNARDALNERYPSYDPNKRIEITAEALEADGASWVRTIVRDTGMGIPDDIRDRVFDPFFTTKGRDQGTGLGLSISHGIVQEHGGRLFFETEPGEGTRFFMDLPFDKDA